MDQSRIVDTDPHYKWLRTVTPLKWLSRGVIDESAQPWPYDHFIGFPEDSTRPGLSGLHMSLSYKTGLIHHLRWPALNYPDGTQIWCHEGIFQRASGPRAEQALQLLQEAEDALDDHLKTKREDIDEFFSISVDV